MDGTRKRKLALMLLLADDDDDDDVGKPCDVCKLALSVQTRMQALEWQVAELSRLRDLVPRPGPGRGYSYFPRAPTIKLPASTVEGYTFWKDMPDRFQQLVRFTVDEFDRLYDDVKHCEGLGADYR